MTDDLDEPGFVIYPPVWLLLGVVAMLVLHFVVPIARISSSSARLLGLLPMVLGLTMLLRSAGAFRRADTPLRPFTESTELLTAGFYCYSRNPIYLGMVLLLAGIALLLGTVSPWVVPPVFGLLIHFRFVLREERDMERTFGASYQDYKKRVRRWI